MDNSNLSKNFLNSTIEKKMSNPRSGASIDFGRTTIEIDTHFLV